VGKGDIGMYNPVPYWKITIKDQKQTLVYFTTQEGHFRALMLRNGKSPVLVGPPAKEIAPPELTQAAIDQATRIWGYTLNQEPATTSARATWASGCENVFAPAACDPVSRNGWKIMVPVSGARLVFRGETTDDLQLIERTSDLERRLPTDVLNKAREIAGKHFQLSPAVIAVDNIDLQTYGDSCLGLGGVAETCASPPRTVIKGYRISVAGKANQRHIYRISNDVKIWRAEAFDGLPVRTDEAPTAIVRKVLNAAQKDLKSTVTSLRILQANPLFECFRNPNAPSNQACFPTQKIKGWSISVSNNQQTMNYNTDLNGTILNKGKS
jgi:hypothetical protein